LKTDKLLKIVKLSVAELLFGPPTLEYATTLRWTSEICQRCKHSKIPGKGKVRGHCSKRTLPSLCGEGRKPRALWVFFDKEEHYQAVVDKFAHGSGTKKINPAMDSDKLLNALQKALASPEYAKREAIRELKELGLKFVKKLEKRQK